MTRNPLAAAVVFCVCLTAAPAVAQDAATLQEIRDLRSLVEKQSRQIDTLTDQIARLNHTLAGRAAAGDALVGAPPAGAGEFSAQTPKAEPPTGRRHVVVKGETLTSIAKTYNMSLSDLQKANKAVDERKLQIGQTLTIPLAATPESTIETKENP